MALTELYYVVVVVVVAAAAAAAVVVVVNLEFGCGTVSKLVLFPFRSLVYKLYRYWLFPHPVRAGAFVVTM